MTPWQVRKWSAEGKVVLLFNKVYVASGLVDTLEARTAAVRLVMPKHAVVTDRTAAWLWGVGTYTLSELEDPPALDVFVLRGRKRVARFGARGGERDLGPRDVVQVDGVLVTTPLRTALDLACRLSRYEALACLDAFMATHDLSRQELQRELHRFRGRRGVVQARALVQLADPRSESSGESFTRCAIHDEGLPPPEPQVWVRDDSGNRWRLDLAYQWARVAIEYDGEQFHSSDEDKAADHRRRTALRNMGWTVIVVDKTSFKGEALFGWLRELRSALQRAVAIPAR